MLAAFAEAARVLHREVYQQIAERNGAFLLRELRTPAGRLHHTWKDGAARIMGAPSTDPAPVPLLQGRDPVDGQAAAYVCVGFTCRPPVTTPEMLTELIGSHPEK